MKSITLTGSDLSHEQLLAVAYGASVVLDPAQLPHVAATAEFLAEQVTRQQPLYGISTGFGSNADRFFFISGEKAAPKTSAPYVRSIYTDSPCKYCKPSELLSRRNGEVGPCVCHACSDGRA